MISNRNREFFYLDFCEHYPFSVLLPTKLFSIQQWGSGDYFRAPKIAFGKHGSFSTATFADVESSRRDHFYGGKMQLDLHWKFGSFPPWLGKTSYFTPQGLNASTRPLFVQSWLSFGGYCKVAEALCSRVCGLGLVYKTSDLISVRWPHVGEEQRRREKDNDPLLVLTQICPSFFLFATVP